MKNTNGFTLIEMAVVLVVVMLLLGGLLVPLATQVEQRRIAETQKSLEEIKEALIGYAASHVDSNGHPYLPCPDAATGSPLAVINDGQEDRDPSTGNCVFTTGNLPWVTLGTGATDAWGNRFFYLVSANVATSNATGLNRSFSSSGNGMMLDIMQATPPNDLIRICPFNGCTTVQALANNVPAVVISYGKNGYGALNVNSATRNPSPPATNLDELTNIPNSPPPTTVVSRTLTAAQTPCSDPPAGGSPQCEFDDIVTWLSPNVLFNRMIAAGRLP